MNLQKNVTLVEHPVVMHDLSILRDKQTDVVGFRAAMERIATVLACFALKDLPLKSRDVLTPLAMYKGYEIGLEIIIVPILRAGLSMVAPFVKLLPFAKVGHLGVYRDETTHKPSSYYSKLPPEISGGLVFIVDPMLATGGSIDSAIRFLKEQGAEQIRVISVISAPEGLRHISEKYPDVSIMTAAIDDKLDDNAFIVPGLGDAGDRYFGTY